MKIKNSFPYGILFIICCLFSACDSGDPKNDVNFDRPALLENIGNNIILPSYERVNIAVNELVTAVNTFESTPNADNLKAAQNAWKAAALAWQPAGMFDFGPAGAVLLRDNVNLFYTEPSIIENNIQSGTYNLDAVNNLRAKGFPAIEYLLFSEQGDDQAILDLYTGENATNRKAYLKDLTQDVQQRINGAYQAWLPNGGNYINQFLNATGTDAGSSLGLLVNEFNRYYENLKNEKIGNPAGVKSLSGDPFPANVEAYYSGYSLTLAKEHLTVVENVYYGKGLNGEEGLGFDDYLAALGARSSKNEALTEAIKSQFENAWQAMNQIPDPLSSAVVENNAVVRKAYDELQKQVVHFKTDMTSAFGVQITYQDNDGD